MPLFPHCVNTPSFCLIECEKENYIFTNYYSFYYERELGQRLTKCINGRKGPASALLSESFRETLEKKSFQNEKKNFSTTAVRKTKAESSKFLVVTTL